MANIVELEDYRHVWVEGEAFCRDCATEWPTICHQDAVDKLECPACGKMTGQLKKETASSPVRLSDWVMRKGE